MPTAFPRSAPILAAENERADVRVEVDLSVSDPLVAFSGDIE